MDEQRKQQFFAELAPDYGPLTGNATQAILAKFLDENSEKLGFSGASVIHDNASGPGTATQVLVRRFAEMKDGGNRNGDGDGKDHGDGDVDNDNTFPTIIATDYSPAMINALRTIQSNEISSNGPNSTLAKAWAKVTPQVLNSTSLLPLIPDNTLTHSITNFSLFTISDPITALREVHRTLKPGGVALITVWKHFAVEDLLRAAQDHIKGPGWAAEHALPTNGPQYAQEGFVRGQLVEAGFEEGKIETGAAEYLLGVDSREDREDWEGLVRFMTGTSIAGGTTRGWAGDEVERWAGAVRWALEREVEREGGVRFEGWVSVVRK